MAPFDRGLRLPARLLLAALLLGPVAHLGLAPAPAQAAEAAPVFEGDAFVELLRPTDLVGDGASPVTLYILALDTAGKPIVGWNKLNLRASAGTVTAIEEAGNGLHRFTFTPARTDARTTVRFDLKGKLPNKFTFERSWEVQVSPTRTHPLALAASPAAIALGTDKSANIGFTVSGGDATALGQAKLRTRVSAGALSNLTNLGGGRFDGLYTPPAGTTPQVVLVTAADAADPGRAYGAVAIPLAATVQQAVQAPAGASVLLKVAGRDFGPVTVDKRGRATIPVAVPAGTTGGTQVVVVNGAPAEAPFALSVPETRRIALFPTAAGLVGDARASVPVRAIVVTPDGRPDEAASVAFGASVGSMSAARHEGGGVYVATWTPASVAAPGEVVFQARIDGAAAVQVDSQAVPLAPVRAGRLSLAAEPAALPVGATSLAVVANVAAPDGQPLAGRSLSVTANGAKSAGVVDQKGGTYRASLTPTGKGPVEVLAAVATPATPNPLARIVAVPAAARVSPDGLSSVLLTVATVDEFGYAVPNVPVDLTLRAGDGSVPATVTTDAGGVARVYYTAGRKNGHVAIELVAGDRVAGVSIVQAPVDVAVPAFPVVAPEAAAAVIRDVAAATATLRVERAK